MTMFKQNAKKGLTLIELVIAATIASFIGFGVYKTFVNGIRVWRWIEKNKPTIDSMVFFEKIALDVRNYCNFEDTSFDGSGTNITFFIQNNQYLSLAKEDLAASENSLGPSVYKVKYEYRPLEKEVKRLLYAIGNEIPLESKVVLSGVSRMRFTFYYFDEGVGEFTEDRSTNGMLPLALGIQASFQDSDNVPHAFNKVIFVPLG